MFVPTPRHDLCAMNPRHSLVAGIIWLVVGLAASFAVAASLWAGSVARDIVVQQHVRRLALETDELGSDIGQAINARLDAVRASSGLPLAEMFEHLRVAYPELGWVAVANSSGLVVATDGSVELHSDASPRAWFAQGRKGAWIGLLDGTADAARKPNLGDISTPLRDDAGHGIGVVVAHLTWHWASSDVQRLRTLILDAHETVLVGPRDLLDSRWRGVTIERTAPLNFERLPGGETILVARARIATDAAPAGESWQVQLSEPKEVVYQRANALAIRIWWISIFLGLATALLGALGARHLTGRLKRLTRSAAAVGRNEIARIEVPNGHDEVAQLGAAFAKVLDDLGQERSELLQLSGELERRVAVRTREVERLAEESRYAAIVRERLQIARDLHDTLAHSMMAMLSEIRLLRKLQVHDPNSLSDELARAEEVAQSGLNEARSAITQMRSNSVRDIGLGPALANAIQRFKDHTGLEVDFVTDPQAARFGDERAEVIFRMTEEVLRNIARHAHASAVKIALRSVHGMHLQLLIEDDGVGFDTTVSRPGHFGLIGLREQAHLIGADVTLTSEAAGGTAFQLIVPLAPERL